MQFGNFVIESPQAERALALYYRKHRFRQVAATRGCIGARKFVSSVGWPKHGILYEFTGMDDGETLFEARMNADDVGRAVVYIASLPLDTNVLFMTVMANGMPFVGRG